MRQLRYERHYKHDKGHGKYIGHGLGCHFKYRSPLNPETENRFNISGGVMKPTPQRCHHHDEKNGSQSEPRAIFPMATLRQ